MLLLMLIAETDSVASPNDIPLNPESQIATSTKTLKKTFILQAHINGFLKKCSSILFTIIWMI